MILRRSLKAMLNQNDSPAQVQIDEDKVQRLLKKIIIAESRNLKSGEKSDKQMIKRIMDQIKEEAGCY